jgi:hypothetical protein
VCPPINIIERAKLVDRVHELREYYQSKHYGEKDRSISELGLWSYVRMEVAAGGGRQVNASSQR